MASWYRDYAAYCGISDDGKKLFAIVFQVGRRKPVLKKPLGDAGGDDAPDSDCPAPVWERRPVRVTFEPMKTKKSTYSVRGHAADLVSNDDVEEEIKSCHGAAKSYGFSRWQQKQVPPLRSLRSASVGMTGRSWLGTLPGLTSA